MKHTYRQKYIKNAAGECCKRKKHLLEIDTKSCIKSNQNSKANLLCRASLKKTAHLIEYSFKLENFTTLNQFCHQFRHLLVTYANP